MSKLILLTLIYGGLFSGSELLSEQLGCPHLLTVIVLSVYLLLLLIALRKGNTAREYGVCRTKPLSDWWFLLPLMAALPVMNLLLSGGSSTVRVGILLEGAVLLLHALAEELLFRGVLPVHWERRGLKNAAVSAVVTNMLFALLHLTVAASGESCWLGLTAAFGVGMFLSGLREKTGSIFPGFALHFLFNLAALLAGDAGTLPKGNTGLWLALSVLYCALGIFLLYKERNQED